MSPGEGGRGCVQDRIFLSMGDRDLGVAFQTHPGSPALFLGEAKYPAFLSSRDGYPLEPKSGLNGVKPPVEFGDKESACQCRRLGFNPWVGKIPWRRAWPPSPLAPNPPSIRVFSNESTLCMRWPKYWSFSFSIIPSKEIPGLLSFKMD